MATFFGFEIKRTGKDKKEYEQKIETPIRPEEEGSTITYGGYGAYAEAFQLAGNDFSSEQELIRRYRKAALTPEIESAIDEIVNEAIVTDENEQIVEIGYENGDEISDNIKKRIEEEWRYLYNILNFQDNGYEYFRSWYVDGRLAFFKNVDKKSKSIVSIQQIDSQKVRKVKEVKEDKKINNVPLVTDINVYYEYTRNGFGTDKSNAIKLTGDSVAYVNSGLLDEQRKYTLSYLHKALKAINQLSAIEDALVIYRITRAPERRIFYIDVGSLPRQKAEQYVKDIMAKYRNKLIYNPKTGEIDDTKKYQTMLEDYWLPRREGGKGTQVETLPGGQAMNQIEDLEYFLRKVYKALNVPFSRFQNDSPAFASRASEITREELKFSRFIQRLRRRFSYIFYDLLKTQLILKGVVTETEWYEIKDSIFFNFAKDSWFAESKNVEIIQQRLSLMRDAQELVGKYYSMDWIAKNILHQTEEERKEQMAQIDKEKKAGIIPKEEEGSRF